MSDKFYLPCECGQQLTVEKRQAGELLPCSCGKQVEVPTIRHFGKLEPVPDAGPLAPVWGLKQGLIFLGLLLALPALACAGYLWWNTPRIVFGDDLYQQVSKITPNQAWALWREFEPGMPQAPTPPVAMWKQYLEDIRYYLFASYSVAAFGLALACGSFLLMPAQKTSRS